MGCSTASFGWNCWDPKTGSGDPDTGNCTGITTAAEKLGDCEWSYLSYFFGFAGLNWASSTKEAHAAYTRRASFFAQAAVNPLRANLSATPPMLVLAGTRDYFYSDGPALTVRACEHGNTRARSFSVTGAFHDWIQYAEGCGGGAPMLEAVEAYDRVAQFVKTLDDEEVREEEEGGA